MIPAILRTAEPLKCKVIDYFMAKDDDVVLGNEVMYGIKRKVVDLLLIRNNSLYAIEIKGDNDNLKLLPEQIEEYSKIFDYVFVFSTAKHKNALEEKLPLHVGLYIIGEESILEIRKPKKQKLHDKKEMLYSINSHYLQVNAVRQCKDSDELRSSLLRKSMNWIHSLLLNFYIDKLSLNCISFKKERGTKSHIDDIPLLNGGMSITS